jgi:Rrf2 family transcriptional repressor of oqxAB
LLQKNYRICYIVVHCLFTSAVPKRTRFTATQEDKMLDYRFPTALQMVLSVAMAEQLGERSTSAILAYGLEANPSFIRKLMVPLTRDGIIVSTLGRNGSIHLGRPAESITLRDIYVSVIEDKKLWASRPDVPARCVVSANACWYFKSIADEAEQASLDVLARHTVASALEKVKKAIPAAASCCQNWIACIKKRINPAFSTTYAFTQKACLKTSFLHCPAALCAGLQRLSHRLIVRVLLANRDYLIVILRVS